MISLKSNKTKIISHNDGEQVVKTGTWFGSGIRDYNDECSLFTNQKNCAITVTPEKLVKGIYKVYVFKVMHSLTSIGQKYTVYHNGIIDTSAKIDFSDGKAEWIEIGTFDIAGNGDEFVRLVTTDQGINYRFGSVAFELLSAEGVTENRSPKQPPNLPIPSEVIQPKQQMPITSPINIASLTAVNTGIKVNEESLRLKKRFTIAYDDRDNNIFNNRDNWYHLDSVIKPGYMIATTTRNEFIEYRPKKQWKDYIVKVNIYKYANVEVDDQVRIDVMFDGKVHAQTYDLNTAKEDWYEIGTYHFTNSGNEGVRLTRKSNSESLPTPAYMVRFDYYYDTQTEVIEAPDTLLGYSQYGNIVDTTYDGYNSYSKVKATIEQGAYAVWNPSELSADNYTVYAYLPKSLKDADRDAKYQIYHNGKVDTVYVDQMDKYSFTSDIDQFNWYKIGTFDFAGTDKEYVKLIRVSDSGTTFMDSIKFQKVYYDGTIIQAVIVTNRDYTYEPIPKNFITILEKSRITSLPFGVSPAEVLNAAGAGISTAYNRELTLVGYRDDEVVENACLTWNPGIVEPGEYNVSIFTHFTIKRDAIIEVHHNNMIDEVLLKREQMAPDNEQSAVYPWANLGKFYFAGNEIEEFLVLKMCDKFNLVNFEKDMGNNGIIHQVISTSHPYFKQTKMKDIDSHPLKEDITYLEVKGLLDETEDGLFRPDDTMTRMEFSNILARILKIDRSNSSEIMGLYTGIPHYGEDVLPKAEITVETALHMLSNGIDYSGKYLNVHHFFVDAVDRLSRYSDSKNISKWALEGVSRAIRLGVLDGYDSKFINPQRRLTRAASVKLIRNFFDIAVNSGPPVDNDWELTMGDEFDHDNMDWTKWTSENYIRFEDLSARWPENAKIKDGKLFLYNYHDNRKVPYSSASITMKERQMHGFFEARYKYPDCYGSHSSFWTTGSYNGKFHGDFNYNEGTFPALISNNNYFLNYEAQVPLVTDPKKNVKAQARDWFAGVSLSKEFHTYSGYAYPEFIAYGFDGKWSHKVENFQEYYVGKGQENACTIDAPYDFILSTVITTFDGPLDKDNIDNTAMEVDWVRVYKKKRFAPQIRKPLDDKPIHITDMPIVTFDKQMDISSITADKIIVSNNAPNFEIVEVSPTKVGIVFEKTLEGKSMYTITVKAGVKDIIGNELLEDSTLTIHTK